MKKLSLLIIGLLISGMPFSQTTVKKVTSKVAIDGHPEESFWDISNQISINLGGSDNTASFGVLWDDNYLYIGVIVTDEPLCTNRRQGWYDDGVEIYIDGNYSQGGTFDKHDRLFVKPVKSYWVQEAEERFEGVRHQWIETDNGYSMEFAIPWDNFNITPAAGMNIGFDIAINDDDDCSDPYNPLSQLLWSGNSNYYKLPSSWGTLNLSNQSVSYSGDYIALISPDGGNFCINNKTTTVNWVSHGITNINIDCSTDNGSSWNSIATNLPAALGSFSWNVSVTPSEQCLIKVFDADNSSVNNISENPFTVSAALTSVNPLIPNFWKNYQWPYNAFYPEDENGINGHVGNACGPSALARMLQYWEFPIVGNDALTFTDNGGNTWSANFGETTYNYDNMPNYLPENSSEEEYTDVATLFYHAATSMHDIYSSGTNLENMSYAMSHYFNYKESNAILRKNYTKAQWIKIIMDELDNGRILLVQGMTLAVLGNWRENNNIAGHWYHVDGYNGNGDFHIVVGYGDFDGYYDANSMSDHTYNLGILTGMEPELNGKALSLESLNDGETIVAGEETEIKWNSTNVLNIKIESTLNDGQYWEIISNSIPASDGTYSWTTPVTNASDCKIKLSDVNDVNVYDKSNETFSISRYELSLLTPGNGNYFVSGSFAVISWDDTPVSIIDIEYTSDNGSNWIQIATNIDAGQGVYEWTVPDIISSRCKVRITDVSNASIFNESDGTFEVGPPNSVCGPYAVDDNTILLLHFENSLSNSSPLSEDGISHGNNISYQTGPASSLGHCLRLDGNSYVSVPNNTNLNLTGDWTVEAWFYFNSFGSGSSENPTIVSKSNSNSSNYFVWYHNNWNSIKGQFTNNNNNDVYVGIGDNALTTGKWYHIAYIRDGAKNVHQLFIRDENRKVIAQQEYQYDESASTPVLNAEDVLIGKLFSASNFYVDGFIDEVRISNVVRKFEGTGMSENNSDDLFMIYPNPSKTSVFISSPNIVNISIYSLNGQKILEKKNFLNGHIDVSGLTKGVYIVAFRDEKCSVGRRLIIE